jgi:hypothetical protein
MVNFFCFVIMLICICYFIKEKRIGYRGVSVSWEESPVIFILFLIMYIVFLVFLFIWMLEDMNIIYSFYPVK